MLQFYFLSVFLNVAVGFSLVFAKFEKKLKEDSLDEDDFFEDEEPFSDESAKMSFSSFVSEPVLQLILGATAFLVGLIKFAYTQDGVPLVGDFLPALAGVVGGIFLLVSWLDSSDFEFELPYAITSFVEDTRRFVGFFCVSAGVIHFVVPRILFL